MSVVEFESYAWWGVLDTTLCDKVCQWLVAGRWFSPGTPVSSTNKTDRQWYNWTIVESGVKEETQVTDKLYHIMLYLVHLTMHRIQTQQR
jgi:hypothetical protein